MFQQQVFKTERFEALVNDKQLTLLEIDSEVLPEAIGYCYLERFGILSLLNPNTAMIY